MVMSKAGGAAAASSKPKGSVTQQPKPGTRKPVVPAAVQREAAARDEAQKQQAAALQDAQSKATAAEERADAAEAALRAADERQGNLSTLLATAGYSSISLHGIDWTVGKAKDLLAEEAASMAEVDALLGRVRSNAEQVRAAITEQEALRDTLAHASPAA